MDFPTPPAETPEQPEKQHHPAALRNALLSLIALIAVLGVAGYFRTVGLFWGDYSYPHPDERFLIWVTADISPVNSLGEYFNTAASSLNPANRGHQFYVYGDFPVILTRYVTDGLMKAAGWQEVLQVGRGLSALFDLLTVFLVFMIAERLSGWKVAAVAGLLSGAAVLQIQQAHFYTTDSFSTFFTTLALYLGVLIATEPDHIPPRRILALNLLFGVTVGLAMASKLNTAVVAVVLPAALFVRWLRDGKYGQQRVRLAIDYAVFAVVSGVLAFIVFRLAQPYAFKGPGLFNIGIDPNWLKSIQDLQAQSAGDVDFPPGLQWARRTHLFSLDNMVLWGLGIPLGVMGWVGFLRFAWRAFRRIREWMKRTPMPSFNGWSSRAPAINGAAANGDPVDHDHADFWHSLSALLVGAWPGTLMIWLWTGVYFLWQSMAWNATMRYQLPIYPTLAILAAWGLGDFWSHPVRGMSHPLRGIGRWSSARRSQLWRAGVAVLGVLVVGLTLTWAFAFTRIYTRTESRVAGSQWIYQNVPGPLTLDGTSAGQPWQQLLGVNTTGSLRPGLPYLTWFSNDQAGVLSVVHLPKTVVALNGVANTSGALLRARIYDPAAPDQPVAVGQVPLPAGGSLDTLDLPVSGMPKLAAGKRYGMAIEVVSATDAPLNSDFPVTVTLDGEVTLGLYAKVQAFRYQSANNQPMSLSASDGGTLAQVIMPEGTTVSPLSVIVTNPQTSEQSVSLAQPSTSNGATVLAVQPVIAFKPGVSYQVTLGPSASGQMLDSSQVAQLVFLDDASTQAVPPLVVEPRPADPLWFTFTASQSADVSQLILGHATQVDPSVSGPTAVQIKIYTNGNTSAPVAQASGSADLNAGSDPRGGSLTLALAQPLHVTENQTYTISLAPDQGALALRGSYIGNESTWDMGLPFRLGNYDPFGGIYNGDMFEMYWDDNVDKFDRFMRVLDQSDYLAFSSNRQWGTTPRVPERYPLTTEFYRRLLGCPADKDVVWCYRVAEPGMFHGDLGYDLVKTSTSYPNLGALQINDQFAEEAFTVYDHAKVMIFKKNADYNAAQVRAILGAVDLTKVVHLTPKKAADYKDLLLPAARWTEQQLGGTWSKLFPSGGLVNSSQGMSLLVWYGFLFLLGLLVYPLVRLALPGLPDRGYPLARIVGLVILAYLAWLAGSLNIAVTRPLLVGIVAVIAIAGLALAYLQREALREEWRAHKGYFIAVELAALALFAIDLGIRFGNPDLWHPIYGGEKPMDFSYFNAVLKSSVFPPYDPWFAGGYINYYYYGFVLVGMPVKLLGIVPNVAYNLVLPALFMMVGLGAFCIGANLFMATRRQDASEAADEVERVEPATGDTPESPAAPETVAAEEDPPEPDGQPLIPNTALSAAPVGQALPRRGLIAQAQRQAILAGITAVFALLLLGNLGTMRMFWQGWQKMVVSDDQMAKGTMVQHVSWAAQGFAKWIQNPAQPWPYYPGDWYWKPSRAIEPEAGNEITEFPLFTFLYADLHAHMMALPVTILAAAWALGMALGKGRWGSDGRLAWLSFGLALLVGALATGLLRPANTWDQYTYLTLAAVALAYGQWRGEAGHFNGLRSLAKILLPPLLLAALAVLFYSPFDAWFAQGYNALEVWKGAKTNIPSYLTHWGLFLFVITAWLFDETVDWMAKTPLASLGRVRRYRSAEILVAAALLALIGLLLWQGVVIALIAVPLGVWAALLLFRPDQPEAKRTVLFMIGTALALTLAVELVAVKGDIGRMNTVFKFYYQAWTLLSLSAAAALVWLWPKLPGWNKGWRNAWQVVLVVLVAGAAMFTLTATKAKISDRMVEDAPPTLDGMLYMDYATYTDGLTQENMREMDLSQDYRAIQWMRETVSGSPVIVEANTPEYRHWGTRYTIYTGLPGVIGWNWHQRQQRTVTPDTWVYDRIADIEAFYQTTDRDQAEAFLKRYNVRYIIVGQLERIWYPGAGLDKFKQYNGVLWDQVYAEGETVIYKVK